MVAGTNGWQNGLQLELFVGSPWTSNVSLTYRRGIIVVVHNQSAEAFPNDNGILVQPGVQVNVK